MRSRELSVHLRDKIVSRHRRKQETFWSTNSLSRSGRQTKLSNQGWRDLVRQETKNLSITINEILSSPVETGDTYRRTASTVAPIRHLWYRASQKPFHTWQQAGSLPKTTRRTLKPLKTKFSSLRTHRLLHAVKCLFCDYNWKIGQYRGKNVCR